jgi:hypothetical protein
VELKQLAITPEPKEPKKDFWSARYVDAFLQTVAEPGARAEQKLLDTKTAIANPFVFLLGSSCLFFELPSSFLNIRREK